MARQWTRRYTLYALSQGMSPKRTLKRDRREWPGGCMCGYILWNEGMIDRLDGELRAKLRPTPGVYLRATHDIVRCHMTPEQVDEWVAKQVDEWVAKQRATTGYNAHFVAEGNRANC